jgi:hypothetical protein
VRSLGLEGRQKNLLFLAQQLRVHRLQVHEI